MSASDRRVTVRAGDRVVCADCRVADRPLARMKGLLGRRSLGDDEGLLIKPAPSVHTGFMRFAIDVVFVDGDDRVVKIVAGIRPWRVAGARRAKHALELAAGRAQAAGLREGDVLALEARPAGGERA